MAQVAAKYPNTTTRASEGVAQAHIARMCHSHCCNLSSDSAPDLPKPTYIAPIIIMVRSRQASRTDSMPRTRAPDGCGRAREPKSRVRHPLAFDWPVAARLKPTMPLTSWPINPSSRIWNLLTKPSNGDGDLGRCSRTHDSRSSASRADGEDASTSLASSTSRATPSSQVTCQRPPTAIWCTHSAPTTDARPVTASVHEDSRQTSRERARCSAATLTPPMRTLLSPPTPPGRSRSRASPSLDWGDASRHAKTTPTSA